MFLEKLRAIRGKGHSQAMCITGAYTNVKMHVRCKLISQELYNMGAWEDGTRCYCSSALSSFALPARVIDWVGSSYYFQAS